MHIQAVSTTLQDVDAKQGKQNDGMEVGNESLLAGWIEARNQGTSDWFSLADNITTRVDASSTSNAKAWFTKDGDTKPADSTRQRTGHFLL